VPNLASAQRLIDEAIRTTGKHDILDLDTGIPALPDYDLVNLAGNGNFRLLGRLNDNGRGLTFYFVAITRVSDGFRVVHLDSQGAELGALKDIVQDLRYDGQLEIVVRRGNSKCRNGSTQLGYFTDSYAYESGKFALADERFRPCYPNVLLP
jgi:hypothetical protein